MVKDKNGNIINNKMGILDRWREHFGKLLNSDDNVNEEQNHINEQQSTEIEEEDPPSLNEVRKAVRKLKNNKSPGEDAIPIEMIRATDASTMPVIHEITNIWDKEELPGELGVGVICPLHKKGDQLVCGNYRGITLLDRKSVV